jgi:hypothetical protein
VGAKSRKRRTMKDVINSIREDHVYEENEYSGSSDSNPSDDDLPLEE